jgi:1-acyl-sn-glycerol-3-phosphate acyltransferase
VQTLNYYWRLVATAFSFSLFGLGGVVVPVLALPVLYLLPGGVDRRRVRARWLVHRTFRVFIYMMRALGVMSWEFHGREKLQRPGILVLANHPTLLDVVFLVAFIPNADCIVKSRLMANPAMRGFVTLTGYITNDSGAKLLESARRSLAEGSALVLFPEGTRTRPGAGLEFQRGAANIVIRTGVLPTPVIIKCTPPTLSKQHKWYHIPPRKFHLSFRVLDDIDVSRFMALSPAVGARQLTRFMEEFIAEEIDRNEYGRP